MCSSIVPLVSNMSMAVGSTSLNVWPPTAKGGTDVMCVASWIRAMRSQRAVYIGMWGCVGATRWSVLLTIQEIWMEHAPSWPSPGWRGMEVSPKHLNTSVKKQLPIRIVRTHTQRQGKLYYIPASIGNNMTCQDWNRLMGSESRQPFAIVRDRGLLSLMKTGRPKYWWPSPATVSQDVKHVFVSMWSQLAVKLKVNTFLWHMTPTQYWI